jgi:hypothetical protein
MILKKFYSFLLLTVMSFCSFAQQADKPFADTAFVYKGFGSGGTTANLGYYSKAVDTMQNVTRNQLDAPSLDTLNFLVRHVKSNRHFQQKVGRSYYLSIINDGQERRIAVIPDWAIIDLENKRQYVFRNTPYAEVYNRFVERNVR